MSVPSSQAPECIHSACEELSTLNDTTGERQFYEGIASLIYNSDELKLQGKGNTYT